MTPEEKGEVLDSRNSDSAIHPFDRYMSDVFARKTDNDPAPVQENATMTPAQPEQQRPTEHAAVETASGSEKLRTEIIARAREADARAREAEEKSKQVEAKFKQEQALRQLAEQRITEIEEEYKQRLSSAQGADFSRLELELALAEAEARLKQESEARWLADTVLARTRDEARAAANTAAIASEEAEKRIIELEGEAEDRERDLLEKTDALKSATLAWNEAERRIAELENALAVSAREGAEIAEATEAAARESAPLIHDAEERAKAAEMKFEDAEARLRFEIERRESAEQKIQSLETEFKSDLELDWARFEADIEKAEAAVKAREETIAKNSAEYARREFQDMIQQLSTQLETEQRTRSEIERRLHEAEALAEKGKGNFKAGAERRLAELEAALKIANSARAEAERKLSEIDRARIGSFSGSGLNAGATAAPVQRRPVPEPKTPDPEVKQRAHESTLRKSARGAKAEPAKTVTRSARKSGSGSSLLTLGLSAEPQPQTPPVQEPSSKEEIKLVGYVAAISLLLLLLIVLGLTIYRRL